ncbi:MAG: hypothetical protein HY665_00325 [Chloroflexi bacterium]|nr:hypothetical protein [Chloroflexota bacterium]
MIKYTTLWEILMKDFDAKKFTFMTTLLGQLIGLSSGLSTTEFNEGKINDKSNDKQWYKDILSFFQSDEKILTRLNLSMSAVTLSRITQALSDSNSTHQDLHELYKELRNRLEDELKLHKFFFLEPDKEVFLSGKDLFGVSVTSAFPSAAVDIEEAGKCIAFERWTASVFHMSRVAEIAMVTIGKRVGYQSHKEGFGEVLNYMDGQLEKARKEPKVALPLFKDDIAFLSAVTAQMHAVNQAWRQRVAHLDTKYTEEEALRIWDATKGLIQQLATKLNENPNE